MEVILNNETVKVVIIRKNNKNIYFRIKNSELVVTCNHFLSEKKILNLINENIDSLAKMYIKAKKTEQKKIENYFLGKKMTVVFDESIKHSRMEDDFIFTKDQKSFAKFIYKETVNVITDRVEEISKQFDFLPPFTLKFRKMTTRWGVCNRTKKTVTINTELIKYDLKVIDYVIIHELCHFKYANHQKDFWNLVSIYCPEYKTFRKLLKE